MRRILRWMTVVVLCCAAGACAPGALALVETPDARLQEAQTAYDQALALSNAGKYAEAVAPGEHALELREAVLGKNHLAVADSLNRLALIYVAQEQYDRAKPLLERALAINEAGLGKNDPSVATSLNNLAFLYVSQKLYSQAEPLFTRAITIWGAALGETPHLTYRNLLDYAQALHNLGSLYQTQSLYSRAEPFIKRALTIRVAATSLVENHPAVAESQNSLANIYRAQGLYGQAEPLFTSALAINEAAFGKNSLIVAVSLNNLANLYRAQGLYSRAEPLYQRALAIRESALGKNHPRVADSLNSLAILAKAQGGYAWAERLHERALAIRESALGKNHPRVADSLNNLGNLYADQGLYGRAEPLYQRAFAILEERPDKRPLDVVSSLNSLGNLYRAQGLYGRAEPLYQRALAILEEDPDKHPLDVADSLNNLALLYMDQGLSGRAKLLYQRAIAIQEATVDKHPLNLAASLNNLANLYMAHALYDRAEPLYQRALALNEESLGKNHPAVATLLNNLANVYLAQGWPDRAEPLYHRAITLWEAAFGKNHPELARSLNNLALLRLSQHRLTEALPLLTRAFAMSEQRLRQEALDFSETRLASFLQFLRTDEARLYALLRAYPDNARVSRLALSATLLLKGRSVEEQANISRTVYRSLGPQEHDTFERLRGQRTHLAQLSLQGPGALPLTAYQQQLKALTEQGDALEADLARKSAPLRALVSLPSPAEIVQSVARALPQDSALVEFITYVDRPFLPRPGTPEPQLRYLALVLLPDATIRALDLGPAGPIDFTASRLRDALANRDAALQTHAQALYQLAFQPLLPLVGDISRLFLSPDGQLALVPFAALHDGHDFLVESFDFTYLTSGRDLLPRPQQKVLATSVAVLADPDFSAPLQAPAPSLTDTSAREEHQGQAHRTWATFPLPGTRKEAEAIQRLLPQAQLFLGAEATKERLLHLPPAGILHMATHGFFLEDAAAPTSSRAVGKFGALGEAPPSARPPDPLLRSGLLFAGASALTSSTSRPTQPPPDSALVTALELASLDLWSTQLVVLSACDTGRGDIKLGQGVYGLRRALVVAGAETVVMSLWKVNDETTSTLMEAYYRNLLAGQGRATALRQAMRWLRATKPEPHYWAPFIVLGQDGPLRSLVPAPREPLKQ